MIKNNLSLNFLFLICVSLLLLSCSGINNNDADKNLSKNQEKPGVVVPEFNADSAYYFIEKQVSFGPRVPNMQSHRDCGDWLIAKLGSYTDTVYVQPARVRAYDGTILNISNIIGSFNPDRRNRILLCAHWDTRPYADADPDPANHYKPIDGANDGASGVGVLLEIARLLSESDFTSGIDIILFDAEDYGKHQSYGGQANDSWALGSQYWSSNPHVDNYYARYGILLDMVGAADASFLFERYSYHYAPGIVNKVWETAHKLGFSKYFKKEMGGYIIDDHYYINVITGIPTINIIHYDSTQGHGFFEQWHTMDDNMDVICKETLKAVGQTVITVVKGDI